MRGRAMVLISVLVAGVACTSSTLSRQNEFLSEHNILPEPGAVTHQDDESTDFKLGAACTAHLQWDSVAQKYILRVYRDGQQISYLSDKEVASVRDNAATSSCF